MTDTKNKICFVGSGQLLLDRARSLGLYVVLIDKQSNVSPDAIALADHVLVCDYDEPENRQKVLRYLRDHGIQKVLTLSEKALNAAAFINAELSGSDRCMALEALLKDKVLMRDKLQGTAFGNVAYQAVNSKADAEQATNTLGLPFILKPSKGVASKGVHLVSEKSQIEEIEIDQSFIAESYIGGDEYSVEAFSANGSHIVYAVTQKTLFNTESARFVERGHVVTVENNSDAFFAEIQAHICGFLDLLGVDSGPTHTEIKICGGKIHIIESHNRVGGDNIPELVFHSTGVDLYTMAIKQAANQPVENTGKPVTANSGILYFDFEPGQISTFSGAQRVKLLPFVRELDLPTGPFLSRPVDSFSRNGYVICSAEDDIIDKMELCHSIIKPIYI